MIKWLVPTLAHKASSRLLGRAQAQHWKMAIRVGSRRVWDGNDALDLDGFSWIDTHPGHLYADPFLIKQRDRTWLFYEHYVYSDRRAVIDVAEIDETGQLVAPRLALRRPYHLSFPYVFEHDGEMFMIPETGGRKTIELYRAVNFPDDWKLEKVLLSNVWAVDTAIWHDGNLWWLFPTVKESPGGANFLYLFYSSELTGNWKPHPANPVCADVRNARGAGKIFVQNGKLLRPSQDCSARYGYRLNFHEIVTLHPERYEENNAVTIDTSWHPGLIGIHTYNQSPGVEVVDGCFYATRAETGGFTSVDIAPADQGIEPEHVMQMGGVENTTV
jgi:hypothetical protein